MLFLCAFRIGSKAKPVIENRYYCYLLHNERSNNVKKEQYKRTPRGGEMKKQSNYWFQIPPNTSAFVFSVALYLLVSKKVEQQRTRRHLIYIILLVSRRPDTVALNI